MTTEHLDQLLTRGDLAQVLQRILDQIEETFIVVDGQWRFLCLNRRAQEVLECVGKDLRGETVAEGLADHGGEALQEELEEAAESGEAFAFKREEAGVAFMIKVHSWADGYTICALDVSKEEAAKAGKSETEHRLSVLAESVNEAFWIYDQDAGQYLYISPAFATLTGESVEPFVRGERDFDELVEKEDRAHVRAVRENLKEGVGEQLFRIRHPDKGIRWWRSRIYPYRDGDHPDGHLIAGVTQDATREIEAETALRTAREQLASTVHERTRALEAEIAEHEKTEAELRRSQFQLLEAQKLAGLGSFDWRLPEDRLEMSDELCRILGLSIIDPPRSFREIREAMMPRDRPVVERLADQLQASSQTMDWEDVLHRQDGEARWLSGRVRVQRSSTGEPLRMFGVTQDITEQRKDQERLERLTREARQLSQRLILSQEGERRQIAGELHDELGQQLTAVKLDLERLAVTGRDDSQELVRRAISAVENIMREVRSLSLDLRPAALDDLGLGPALRWFLDRQAKAFEGRLSLSVRGLDRRLPEIAEISCFRVIQEAVTNALKHGGASRIRVEVRGEGDRVEAVVQDDGRGFDLARAEASARKGRSFGILGMRERARLSGGELDIRTSPGAGARVHLSLPVTGIGQAGRSGGDKNA